MVFESLFESAQKGELILINGGFCRYHMRTDRQLTIKEIISTRKGAGSEMLAMLTALKPYYILAKCPADLEANKWYEKKGFKVIGTEKAKSGRLINIWVK